MLYRPGVHSLRHVFVAVLLVLVLTVAGFGPYRGTHATAAPARVLTMSDEGTQDLTPTDLDPPAENLGANAIQVISLIFGGLVRLDANLHVAADGASSWNVSRDGRTYTFHIRRGLRFANGTPVVAQDFAYSLNRAFSPKFASASNTAYYLSNITGGAAETAGKAKSVRGVKVLNRSTLRIHTNTRSAVFLDQLAFSASYVVPRGVIQKYGKNWTEHALGTGPFYVKRIQHSKEVDLVPNPYYWRGKPKLSLLRVLFFQNPVTAYNEYRIGGLDVMGAQQFPSDKLTSARKLPNFHQVDQLATTYLTPNEKKAPFNSVHVRRAFSLAINRAVLTNTFLNGAYAPAHTILPPGLPGYEGNIKGETFNPNLAKAELAKAGYPNGKGLPRITLSFTGGDAGQLGSAQVLQRYWKAYLGVNVQLNQLEAGAYNNLLSARSYQIAYISWGADYPDPQNFLSLQLQSGTGNNNGSFSDHTFDRLTTRADALVGNNARRFALYHRAEGIALDQAAWIVLYHSKANVFISKRVHGLEINGGGLTAANWATVTVK